MILDRKSLVICDECGKAGPFSQNLPEQSMYGAVEMASNAGWRLTTQSDLCPDCLPVEHKRTACVGRSGCC